MALCEKILIAGFSGAGKSTFLEELRKTAPAGWSSFEDLDELILMNTKKKYAKLADLIDEQGWEAFRLLERQTLEGWLKDEEKGVLALGGGTLTPLVWDLYKRGSKLKWVHLKAPFEVCWSRLIKDVDVPRPLVKLGKLELERIYNERAAVFNQLSITILNHDGTDLSQAAKKLWSDLDVHE